MYIRKVASMALNIRLMAAVAVCLSIGASAIAQESGEKTFGKPSEARAALYDAVKSGDKSNMLAVLGSSASSLVSSGDAVQDEKAGRKFIERFDAMNRWGKDTSGGLVLYIGVDNWPFPIPLKKDASGQWYFDAKSGVQEVLYRRIGANELAAIRVISALSDAQQEYFNDLHDGSTVKQYAQRLFSEPGKHNGLYWKAADNEPQSPIGPIVVYATEEGYGQQKEKPEPFHGYFYRTLKSQGSHAKGGAKNYVVNGTMTGGYAFIGYPAEYRNSGIMTFLIDKEGVVYEKNLGEKTTDLAKAMTAFDPDTTWKPVSNYSETEEPSE